MSNSVERALKLVDRRQFLLAESASYASDDRALDIGYGQTNSQPTTVKLMLEWLDVKKGQTVLDVGSGSGWSTALLSELVGKNGQVFAVERISQLLQFGRNNCKKAGITNARFYQSTRKLGLEGHSPYDRILVSAATNEVPQELIAQLYTKGKMVIPIDNSIYEISKNKNKLDIINHPGFIFVPLLPSP